MLFDSSVARHSKRENHRMRDSNLSCFTEDFKRRRLSIHMHTCIYTHMIDICICVHVYIYIYKHIYIYNVTRLEAVETNNELVADAAAAAAAAAAA